MKLLTQPQRRLLRKIAKAESGHYLVFGASEHVSVYALEIRGLVSYVRKPTHGEPGTWWKATSTGKRIAQQEDR